jgi:ribosome-binding factor A
MLAGKRAVRVGDHILREIAILLLHRVRDPRVQGVTITGIRLSDDLKQARVFYSVMGEENRIRTVQEIGMRLSLRYVPDITFVHDSSLESASHMEKVFQELHKAKDEDTA